MSVKRTISLLLTVCISLFSATICFADNTPALLQGYAWENNVDLFVSGIISTENVSVNVANQTANVTDCGHLSDKGVTIRTTILLDISGSMPKALRDNVKTYINNCIDKLGNNEQLKIVTFGEQITTLQDFTSDRYDLSQALAKIEFTANLSMIYDAVYNTIPLLLPLDEKPCYYRTIIITDGADESKSGITKEELYLKLQNETYPVEVVEVGEEAQRTSERELSALARISGGRFTVLDNGTDLGQLLTTEHITWIRAKLPDVLADGSTRQFNISDGSGRLQFDMKVAAYSSPVQDSASEEPVETIAPVAETPSETPLVSNSIEATVPATNEIADVIQQKENSLILIIVLCVVAALLAALLAFVIIRKKMQSKRTSDESAQEEVRGTEILSEGSSLYLHKMDEVEKKWHVSLASGVTVGREKSCEIFLDEDSVSRCQCVIYMGQQGEPIIENKSTSNITQVNKTKIQSPQELFEGDQIKCGRIVLIIDTINKGEVRKSENINKLTQFVNV